jgi:5'-AMP-activated protein kinase catalytic alpha subunit
MDRSSTAYRIPAAVALSPCLPGSPVVAPNKIGPYLLEEVIGEGGFSVVRAAFHEETNTTFACKVIPKRRLHVMGLMEQLGREVSILTALKHPAICTLCEVLYDTINCYVIMELCPQGSLRNRIVQRLRIPEPQAKRIFRQLMEAIAYIHSRNISHRDLKPENILIDDCDQIKLIDFGLSNFQGEDGLFSTRVGSASYAAPECFRPERYNGYKCDVWSCGIVLFTMLTGQLPWVGHNEQKIIQQICQGEVLIPIGVSPEATDLLNKILTLDTDKRLSAEQILKHPFLANVSAFDDIPRGIKGSCSQPLSKVGVGNFTESAVRLIQKGRARRLSRLGEIPRVKSFTE